MPGAASAMVDGAAPVVALRPRVRPPRRCRRRSAPSSSSPATAGATGSGWASTAPTAMRNTAGTTGGSSRTTTRAPCSATRRSRRCACCSRPEAARSPSARPAPLRVVDAKGKAWRLPAGSYPLTTALKLEAARHEEGEAAPGPLVFTPLRRAVRARRRPVPRLRPGRRRRRSPPGREQPRHRLVRAGRRAARDAFWVGARGAARRRPSSPARTRSRTSTAARSTSTRTRAARSTAASAQSGRARTRPCSRPPGQVVLYDGVVAQTFFFSTSGGRTAAIQDAWPKAEPLPYLVSVPDPYDASSPYHNWGPPPLTPTALGRRLHVPGGRVVDAQVQANGSRARADADRDR